VVPCTLVLCIPPATLGHVDYALLAALVLGGVPGIWLGARLTRRLPERVVRTLLCGALLAAGVKVMS
jgi:uncharacterized protein